MTNQIIVSNNLRHNFCPCCCSSDIKKIGDLPSIDPSYSSLSIKLKYVSEMWKCNVCNSGFIQNAVQEIDSISLYQQGDFNAREKTQPFSLSKTKEVVSEFSNALQPSQKVLDIGCSTGEFLDFAKSKDCFTVGVEYSKANREVIESKGHTYFPSLDVLVEGAVKEKFDLITAFDLVEHLYDLPKFLNQCYEILSFGGHLAILTGNIGCLPSRLAGSHWWYASFPEHIIFPSRKYFSSLANFKLVKCIDTFAAPKFITSKRSTIKATLKNCLRRNYNGSPSITFDHVLIFLRK